MIRCVHGLTYVLHNVYANRSNKEILIPSLLLDRFVGCRLCTTCMCVCARQKLIHVVTSRLAALIHSPLTFLQVYVCAFGIFPQKIACDICRATACPPFVCVYYNTLGKLCVAHVLHFNSCKQCWNLEMKRSAFDAHSAQVESLSFCSCCFCWMVRVWWKVMKSQSGVQF